MLTKHGVQGGHGVSWEYARVLYYVNNDQKCIFIE